MRRLFFGLLVSAISIGGAAPALACGGLIGPNGAVNLLRTSTLAAYHDGTEHYVTAFEFAGGGGQFGSIVPLPDVPAKIERGGEWTLQRLQEEFRPPPAADLVSRSASLGGESAGEAREVMTERIDALDIIVIEGNASEVGLWAKNHGFRLPPDAPEVLDFYAERSPIFMAAVFDADAAQARGQQIGDGTPIHLTIPTDNPWVPLRILALGKDDSEPVQADVFLLTDSEPEMLPGERRGFDVKAGAPASASLMDDLRSDAGMGWMPEQMWVTFLEIDMPSGDLTFDLALDVHGGFPSRVDAGLSRSEVVISMLNEGFRGTWPLVGLVGLLLVLAVLAKRLEPSRWRA